MVEASEPEPASGSSIATQLRRAAWRLIVLVVGGTVLAIGVVMLVAPGPGLIVIPAGLAILATEFVWARRLLARVREYVKNTLGNTAKKS